MTMWARDLGRVMDEKVTTCKAWPVVGSKYKDVFKNGVINTLMPRSLFGILYTQGAWVAGGTHKTFIDI